MNPSHQRKIEKLGKHIDAKQTELPDSELLVSLIDIEDKLDEVLAKEDPEQKDYTDKLDMIYGDIMNKLNEEKEDEEIVVELKIV